VPSFSECLTLCDNSNGTNKLDTYRSDLEKRHFLFQLSLLSNKKEQLRAGKMAQVVEHWPRKYEVLSSKPNTKKNERTVKKDRTRHYGIKISNSYKYKKLFYKVIK
jgi:hypothetical protein